MIRNKHETITQINLNINTSNQIPLTQKCVHIHAHVLFFINSYIHSSLYIQFTIYYLVIFSVKAKVVK